MGSYRLLKMLKALDVLDIKGSQALMVTLQDGA